MNRTAVIEAIPRHDVCPYCGQPVTHRKLEEIRERVRHEEQTRLKALEKQLREHAAAEVRAQAQQLATRTAELAKQERVLRERMKAAEVAAKARFDEGYRKATAESQRTQLQLQKQIEDLKRRVERAHGPFQSLCAVRLPWGETFFPTWMGNHAV